MEGTFQVFFSILSWTSVMVLVVLGLGVIASMMGIFNFAHGDFMLLGGYTLYLFSVWGFPLWFGIVAAPIVVGIVGVILERTVIHRFYAAPIAAMLGTYALGVIIRETVRGLIDGMYLRVPAPMEGLVVVGDISIAEWRIAVLGSVEPTARNKCEKQSPTKNQYTVFKNKSPTKNVNQTSPPTDYPLLLGASAM